ncbi:hypothetical protein RUM44_012451 [Polyplax serrata]|uniref:Condensin-2 complex subunit H2 C-terminal domain-containing protein n=1 Tax=Polyplax serrata TaxID=468196 RepID=A0ABR1BF57_POLSC
MTLPSQFSLEEENFYKDIQDLVKKGSQNGRELSVFLERYKDLLGRAGFDDETFIINFAKAGLIIEASAKVYGIKVDSLWTNLEHVLESLKNKGPLQGKKKSDCENEGDLDGTVCDDNDFEDKRKGLGCGRRRKKPGDALFSSDDFLEIDSITGLLGKSMNETNCPSESKIKLCEKIPNMFIKNKTKKKKMDVCLNKSLDKDVIRLRDWIISTECLLIKEIYTQIAENIYSISRVVDNEQSDAYSCDAYKGDDNIMFEDKDVNLAQESLKLASCLKDEKNNNFGLEGLPLNNSIKLVSDNDNLYSSPAKESFVQDLNISRESDMAKFPNILERVSGDCLVDVDEVFWNPSKFQDVISSKKMRAGKSNKLTCQLCVDKKLHKKKGKKCLENKKVECLDSYFTPHVQPVVTESPYGILPDEELFSAYKAEMKLIEQLKKVDSCKNTNGAYHPDENVEELRNFLGFDGFETSLIRKPEILEEPELGDNVILNRLDGDDDHCAGEDNSIDRDLELPLPIVENDVVLDIGPRDKSVDLNLNDPLGNSESEYQKLVNEELKEHYAAKSSFAKNKELGLKISKWFEMISDKIKLSQKRGALNMKSLAVKIMNGFPAKTTEEKPVMPFQELVKAQSRRDIPRYFFACLQLANEGNLEIGKSSTKPLATDCMMVKRLKDRNTSFESEDNSTLSPSKNVSSPRMTPEQMKRKRNLSCSPPIVEGKIHGRQKRLKQKLVKSCKRPKKFNNVIGVKRRRCSISSMDSMISE